MARAIFSLLIFILLKNIIFSQGFLEKKLHNNWEFQKKGDKKWYTATVPGCIHTDLMDNGIIKDPYYRLNESKVQWVDKEDWVYKSTFTLKDKEYKKQHHEIKFEGLDKNIYKSYRPF